MINFQYNRLLIFIFRLLFQKSVDDREYSPIVKDGASRTDRKKSDRTSSESVSIDIDQETISSAGDYDSNEWKRTCTFTHIYLYACTFICMYVIFRWIGIYDM